MTFVETLVVVAITSLVGVLLASGLAFFYRTNAFVFEQSAAIDSARKGIEFAMRDLREASYGDDGAYPFLDAATSSVTFFADIDSDPSVEKVRYMLLGSTLHRGVTSPAGNPPSYANQPEATSTIAGFVRNFSFETSVFRYFDANGVELVPPLNVADVVSVSATVIVNIDANRAPDEFILTGSATLRNLRIDD